MLQKIWLKMKQKAINWLIGQKKKNASLVSKLSRTFSFVNKIIPDDVELPKTKLELNISKIQKEYGFSGKLDLGSHPKLEKIRDEFAINIFTLLKQKFVPGFYYEILKQHPLPGVAFQIFCKKFGVRSLELVRIDYEKQKIFHKISEIKILDQVIGILVQVRIMDLSIKDRDYLFSLMRVREYERVEELIDIAQIVLSAIKEAEKIKSKIVVAGYDNFLNYLNGIRGQLFNRPDGEEISKGDAQEINEYRVKFILLSEKVINLQREVGGQLAWLYDNWPNTKEWINAYGKASHTVKNIEIDINNILRVISVDADKAESAIQELAARCDMLRSLIEKIILSTGKKGSPKSKYASNVWEEWTAALSFFEYNPTEHAAYFDQKSTEQPSSREIKAKYRELAIRFHPDRHPGKSSAEIKELSEKFIFTKDFYDILTRGKPILKGGKK